MGIPPAVSRNRAGFAGAGPYPAGGRCPVAALLREVEQSPTGASAGRPGFGGRVHVLAVPPARTWACQFSAAKTHGHRLLAAAHGESLPGDISKASPVDFLRPTGTRTIDIHNSLWHSGYLTKTSARSYRMSIVPASAEPWMITSLLHGGFTLCRCTAQSRCNVPRQPPRERRNLTEDQSEQGERHLQVIYQKSSPIALE